MSEQPADNTDNLENDEQKNCEIPASLAKNLKMNCGNQERQGDVSNDGNTLTSSLFFPLEAATNEGGGKQDFETFA